MSDVPDIVIDAADVGAGRDIPWDVAARIAERLHAAGLLADPTTSRTDTEQAVIDAANRYRQNRLHGEFELFAAVDRHLAAPGLKEATCVCGHPQSDHVVTAESDSDCTGFCPCRMFRAAPASSSIDTPDNRTRQT